MEDHRGDVVPRGGPIVAATADREQEGARQPLVLEHGQPGTLQGFVRGVESQLCDNSAAELCQRRPNSWSEMKSRAASARAPALGQACGSIGAENDRRTVVERRPATPRT